MSFSSLPALPFCPIAVDSIAAIDNEIARKSVESYEYNGYVGSNFPIGLTLNEVVNLYYRTAYIDFYPWLYSEVVSGEGENAQTIISSAYVTTSLKPTIVKFKDGGYVDEEAGTDINSSMIKRQCGALQIAKNTIVIENKGSAVSDGVKTVIAPHNFFQNMLIPSIGEREEFIAQCLYEKSTGLYYPAFSFFIGIYAEAWSTFLAKYTYYFNEGFRKFYSTAAVSVSLHIGDSVKYFTMYRDGGLLKIGDDTQSLPPNPADYSFPSATVAFFS